MLRFLLDSNIAILVIRQRPPGALAVFNQQAGRMALSAISLAELLHGAEKSSRPSANMTVVEDFCSRLEVLPYGAKAAQHCGQIRTALEQAGTLIGVNDLHITAHGRSEGLVVVTIRWREFDRVRALPVEHGDRRGHRSGSQVRGSFNFRPDKHLAREAGPRSQVYRLDCDSTGRAHEGDRHGTVCGDRLALQQQRLARARRA